METFSSGNLFPKISGKHTDFLAQLRRLKEEGRLPEMIDIEGTVKLHGMHADIVFDLRDLSNTRFQSRNRVCDPTESQHGWPAQIASQPAALRYLRNEIVQTFSWANPTDAVDKTLPLIVAGEWIGEGVQRDVGIAQISPRFVILSVSINGQWQKDSDYRNIRADKAGIDNIFTCGSVIVQFDTTNITEDHPALFELQRFADEVEKSCPFAAHNGVENSRGEGIVWKPGVPEGRSNPRCWLKTKGPSHDQANRIDAVRVAVNQKRYESLSEAVTRWVTPRRIEQGFEYLLEMQMTATRESLKVYMKWMVDDVLTEEDTGIEKLVTKLGIKEKAVKSKIEYMARDAYLDAMRKSGLRPAWSDSFEGPRLKSLLEQALS